MTLTPNSLQIDPDVTDDEWIKIGERLGQISSASQWWIGDWLIDGDQNKRGRYDDAVEATGLDVQTLYNYGWVAGQIPPEMRNPDVSWSHHLAVARKDLTPAKKKKYLDNAKSGHWPVKELKAIIRKDMGAKDLTGEFETCPTCGSKVKKGELP